MLDAIFANTSKKSESNISLNESSSDSDDFYSKDDSQVLSTNNISIIKNNSNSNDNNNNDNKEKNSIDCQIIYKSSKCKNLNTIFEHNQNENYDNNFKLEDDIYKIPKKKRGRINKKNNKLHSRKENGNIRSKIKNTFFNFIIKFINEKIKQETKLKLKFRKIDYNIINIRNKKSKLNLDFFLNKKLKNFLEFEISEIYKKPKDQNKKTLQKIEKCGCLKNYLEIPIKTFYKEYFLKKKNLNSNSDVVYYQDFINKIKRKIVDTNFFKSSDDDNFYLDLLNKYSYEEFLKFYNNLFVVKK
jgi:hypothetical protein